MELQPEYFIKIFRSNAKNLLTKSKKCAITKAQNKETEKLLKTRKELIIMAKVNDYVKQLEAIQDDVKKFERFQKDNAEMLNKFFKLRDKADKTAQTERKSAVKQKYMADIVVGILTEADEPMEARKLFAEAGGEALYPNIRTFYSALARRLGNRDKWDKTLRKEVSVTRYYVETNVDGNPVSDVFSRKVKTITYELNRKNNR